MTPNSENRNPAIAIAEHCGLCFGARRSVGAALDALREGAESNRPVVIHKEILHNKAVMDDLEKRGAIPVQSLDGIPENALVVVRAHGEGKAFHDNAAKQNLDLRDATCVNVKRIHTLVHNAHAAGKAVLILGKHGHPETEGANGWCENTAAVIENDEDANAFPAPAAGELFAVCQTTISREKARRLIAILRKRFPGKTVTFADTVCSEPLRIHAPSLRLAAECDILFTIGGEKSSNTAELRAACEKAGKALCPPQTESCADFAALLRQNPGLLRPASRYGFTAGASTPLEEVEKCRDLLAFLLFYQETKSRLERKMDALNRAFASEENRILREAGEHFAAVNKGGKLLRAALAVLGFAIARDRKTSAENAAEDADALALAFEVFQTAVLVHDDLIDNAALRRGRKTIPARYRDAYAAAAGDSIRAAAADDSICAAAAATGDAMAVCIGDRGLFAGVEILTDAYGKHPLFADLLALFVHAVQKTIQGEILDTVLPFEQRAGIRTTDGDALLASIREIQHSKTAWYTAIGPLLCGMLLGGASAEEREALRGFADNLGIAFQIQDDIMGVFGDEAALGKDVGADIEEYKQTLLYAYARALSPALFRELLTYYGKPGLLRAELNRVHEIFTESGALAAATREMERRFARAREILDAASFLSADGGNLLRGALLHFSLREK